MRTLLTLAAATLTAAALLILTACKPADQSSRQLRIYAWSEYIPHPVLKKFEEETGIKVTLETFSSNEEMLAKLLAGGGRYDIIQPSDYVVEAMAREGLLLPLDHSQLPNLKNLAPEFTDLPYDPGNRYSVPWLAGTVGIVINRELLPDSKVSTYDDVFQEPHRGRIVIVDDAREMTAWALASLGIGINDFSEHNLEKARAVLQRWLPFVRIFDSDSPKTSLLNGDAAIGIIWSGEGAILLNQDKKFEWALPPGAHLYVDTLAIPKNAPNPHAAHAFINFILRPEISALISEEFPYLNPNLAARKLLPPEALANRASYPTPEEFSRLEIFRDIGQKAAAIDEMVTSLKAGR